MFLPSAEATNVIGVERNTDSISEHSAEMKRAKQKNRINKPIKSFGCNYGCKVSAMRAKNRIYLSFFRVKALLDLLSKGVHRFSPLFFG